MDSLKARMPIAHLRAWRVFRFMTQSELAEKAGVGTVTIWKCEQRQHVAQVRTIRALAEALGVTPAQLAFEMPPRVA